MEAVPKFLLWAIGEWIGAIVVRMIGPPVICRSVWFFGPGSADRLEYQAFVAWAMDCELIAAQTGVTVQNPSKLAAVA
jgi:hypothetical protein